MASSARGDPSIPAAFGSFPATRWAACTAAAAPDRFDPLTGHAYGPTFPAITLGDQVRFIAASSTPWPSTACGAWRALRWAPYYTSERLFRVACADAVPHGPGAQAARSANTQAFLDDGLDAGVAAYDANCFIATLSAINTHDLGEGFTTFEEGVRRIRCPLLLVNIDSDQEFPPCAAEEIARVLNAIRPAQATLRVISSMWGHLGCVREPESLAACVREWPAFST